MLRARADTQVCPYEVAVRMAKGEAREGGRDESRLYGDWLRYAAGAVGQSSARAQRSQ
jgi:hypothetical protein